MVKTYQSHIDQTIAAMNGRCLLLGPMENIDRIFPSSVTSITEWHNYPDIEGTFDTILSIENLASFQDLNRKLQNLLLFTHSDSLLLFCDQTATPINKSHTSRQDITGALWNNGWSVIECYRNSIGKSKRASRYVQGKARPKRSLQDQN